MTNLENTEQARDSLRAKLDDKRLELAALDEARKEIAFEAHTIGGEAEKKLAKLNKDRVVIIGDLETLEQALLEASRRVEDALHSIAVADEAEKGRKALALAASIKERAAVMDNLLSRVASESMALKSDIRELNFQLGCSHPHEHQLQAYGERAVKAHMMAAAFKIEHLAPKDRYTFAQLAEGWAATIERWAESRLPQLAEVELCAENV